MTGLDTGWEADWLAAVEGDAEFRLISRWTEVALRLVGQDFDRSYRIDHATIGVQDGGAAIPTVTLTGSAAAWDSYLEPVPRPPAHHILAMQRRRSDFSIDGRHALLQNLNVLNRVLDLMRTVAVDRQEGTA
ncbi:hypothetical protein M1247_20625 [Mycobacterium sp. 21AC1]|uniref:hypothetical protein n=1 Tax=[Mycobacterium] appelbergii TaxID=2939269 RepID=UPI002938DD2C|nr:hypothetical protein [Mycobacterium sp. 21AC1]MDV3127342.1 hypothetical protein [Mycobacterium sp. 21AC1]